ncbi:MAG: hypothetical protein GF411_18705 [Candidatus Lokiarchaeota archaeon]|nr:hypothetical protein [Candidatus Lokiarchaeota archaeon]
MKVTLLQIIEQDPTLLLLSLVAMTFFAVLSTIGIYFYSSKKIYRYWAISTLLFTFAWIPSTIIYNNVFYLGTLGDISIRITAIFLLLRGFDFKPMMKIESNKIRLIAFGIILSIYAVLVGFNIPSVLSSTIVFPLMGIATFNAGNKILNVMGETLLQKVTGYAFYFWSATCFILTIYAIFPAIYPLTYFQSIGLSLTNMMLFLMYIEDTRRETEEYLNISQILGSLLTHDLRNYLNIAYSAVELVEVEGDESTRYITMAQESLISAMKFMENSRNTIRSLFTGKVHKQNFDLTHMLEVIRKQVTKEHDLEESSIILKTKSKTIIKESILVEQIVWNIVDNAVVHATINPEIIMSIEETDKVILTIQDNAGGISEEIRRSINEGSYDSNLLGIGLNIIIRLSLLLDIEIEIQNNIENEKIIGSIFRLHFPNI